MDSQPDSQVPVVTTDELANAVGKELLPTLTSLITSTIKSQIDEKFGTSSLNDDTIVKGRASGIPNDITRGRAREIGTHETSNNSEVDEWEIGRAKNYGTRYSNDFDEISELSEGELDPYDQAKTQTASWQTKKETGETLSKYLKTPLNKAELKNVCEKYPPLSNTVAQMPRIDQSFVQMLNSRGVHLR